MSDRLYEWMEEGVVYPTAPVDLAPWLEAQIRQAPEPPNAKSERDHFDHDDYWSPSRSKARGGDPGMFGGDY